MDFDKIADLLDLGAAPAPAKGGGASPAVVNARPAAPAKPAGSPTALALDKWDVARGASAADRSTEVAGLGLPDPAHAMADFHAVAFKPYPEAAEDCSDRKRAAYVGALLESGEVQALRVSTVLNQMASDVAAAEFAKGYAAFLKAEEEKDQPAGGGGRGDEGEGKEGGGGRGDEGEGKEGGVLAAAAEAAALTAARVASKEVEELEETATAFGMGAGAAGAPMNAAKVAGLYKRVRNDPALRKIVELAGRFRRVAQAKQRTKVRHGYDDTVGVTLDGDVSRLLPHELARLAVPELELDTMRRIVEREAMCRQHRGCEQTGRGPVIVVVDESGSMDGDKVHAAKAFALAMAWVAKHQRRWCALVAYTGSVYPSTVGTHTRLPNGAGLRLLPLPPGRPWDQGALAVWLTEFMTCGSDRDVPVVEMPAIYEQLKAPQGKTDVVFVTDAECQLQRHEEDAFNAWKKKAKARLVTLLVGGHGDDSGGALRGVSDEVHNTAAVVKADDEAVGRCLGV